MTIELNIPSCLNLSEFEKNKAQEFADRMYEKYKERIHAAAEEDCAPMSSFTFEVTYTSIGDNIIIKYGNEQEFLPDPELF